MGNKRILPNLAENLQGSTEASKYAYIFCKLCVYVCWVKSNVLGRFRMGDYTLTQKHFYQVIDCCMVKKNNHWVSFLQYLSSYICGTASVWLMRGLITTPYSMLASFIKFTLSSFLKHCIRPWGGGSINGNQTI